MNKAAYFFRTGRGICDECDKFVEPERIAQARGLGPFLCQRCATRITGHWNPNESHPTNDR